MTAVAKKIDPAEFKLNGADVAKDEPDIIVTDIWLKGAVVMKVKGTYKETVERVFGPKDPKFYYADAAEFDLVEPLGGLLKVTIRRSQIILVGAESTYKEPEPFGEDEDEDTEDGRLGVLQIGGAH